MYPSPTSPPSAYGTCSAESGSSTPTTGHMRTHATARNAPHSSSCPSIPPHTSPASGAPSRKLTSTSPSTVAASPPAAYISVTLYHPLLLHRYYTQTRAIGAFASTSYVKQSVRGSFNCCVTHHTQVRDDGSILRGGVRNRVHRMWMVEEEGEGGGQEGGDAGVEG